MENQYPASWQSVSLAELGMGRTQSVNPSSHPTTAFEVWSVPSFPTGLPEILFGKDIGSSKQRVQCGDVLLCKINPRINRVWVVGEKRQNEQIASTEWIVFRAKHLVPEYLAYAFQGSFFRKRLTANVSGVGGSLTRARPTDVANLEIPIAPANEQRRIVAKLNALFEKSRSIREKLDRLPRLLANLQKSILNSAFRGDLTKDWRANNPTIEPASQIMERIRAERWAKWEADLIAKGKDPKKSKYVEPEPVDTEGLPELPEGWCWVALGEVAWSVKDGPHFSPKYSEDGIPFISARNISPTGIRFSDAKFISSDLQQELIQRCKPERGDVLYTKGGTTGIAHAIDVDTEFNVWVHVAVLKIIPSIRPLFLQHMLNSPHCYIQAQKFTHGAANQDLGLTRMVKISLPLPPVSEQIEIEKKLSSALDNVRKLAEVMELSLIKCNNFASSVLNQAFRGELVPQDPSDEPASLLLERIRAQKPAAGMKRGRGRKAAA